jgi:hypothetical protein
MNAELTIYDEFQTEGKGAIVSNFQEILSIAHRLEDLMYLLPVII